MHCDLMPLVQLCDAPAAHPTTYEGLLHESRSDRLAPGDGDMSPHQLLETLSSSIPVSLEVPNEVAVHDMGPQRWANYLATATRNALSVVQGASFE